MINKIQNRKNAIQERRANRKKRRMQIRMSEPHHTTLVYVDDNNSAHYQEFPDFLNNGALIDPQTETAMDLDYVKVEEVFDLFNTDPKTHFEVDNVLIVYVDEQHHTHVQSIEDAVYEGILQETDDGIAMTIDQILLYLH